MCERFGDREVMAVLDETGSPRKGPQSAGVHQPDCGALGTSAPCQEARRLREATPQGHVCRDRRLVRSAAWGFDRARGGRATVPAEGTFQTKSEQARALRGQAWQARVPLRGVTGDAVSGDAPRLRERIQGQGCC